MLKQLFKPSYSMSAIALSFVTANAWAGPPFINDDPAPTEYKKYEIYAFQNMSKSHDGKETTYGIDYNYGGFENTQLTAVLPWVNAKPNGEKSKTGFGNAELAVKYKFLQQEKFGIDVAFFPRLFLPTKDERFGTKHSQLLLPIFVQNDFGKYSAFGGGGCTINKGGDSQNFCNWGAALSRQFTEKLRIGGELFNETSDTKGGKSVAGYGIGAIYDLTPKYHLLASYNENRSNRNSTYKNGFFMSLLTTY